MPVLACRYVAVSEPVVAKATDEWSAAASTKDDAANSDMQPELTVRRRLAVENNLDRCREAMESRADTRQMCVHNEHRRSPRWILRLSFWKPSIADYLREPLIRRLRIEVAKA